MDSIKIIKKIESFIMLALIFSVIALLSSIVKNIVTEKWAKTRNEVACIPADSPSAFPMVYHQTAANRDVSDAIMKSFVEEYVHLTQDEQIVDYHKATHDGRYNDARLSEARFKALEMSAPGSVEMAKNKLKFAKSSEVFNALKKSNAGWVFLIDDILIFPLTGSGEVLAVVRGQFQVTYDRVKSELPDNLWGYRELRYYININQPTEDTKGKILNKYGLFVSLSEEEILSSTQREQRTQRNSDYYMKEHSE